MRQRIFVRSERGEQRLAPDEHSERIDERRRGCEPRGGGPSAAHHLVIAPPERTRQQARAAYAEKVRDRREHEERGKDERHRRHHARVVELADVPRVCDVVDHRYYLADDRRHGERRDGPRHGHRLENLYLFFAELVFHRAPLKHAAPRRNYVDRGSGWDRERKRGVENFKRRVAEEQAAADRAEHHAEVEADVIGAVR